VITEVRPHSPGGRYAGGSEVIIGRFLTDYLMPRFGVITEGRVDKRPHRIDLDFLCQIKAPEAICQCSPINNQITPDLYQTQFFYCQAQWRKGLQRTGLPSSPPGSLGERCHFARNHYHRSARRDEAFRQRCFPAAENSAHP
jgi:hypothetical protein